MQTITRDEPAGNVHPPFDLSWPVRLGLAALSAGAATIHFASIGAHASEWLALAIGFALVGWFQLVFAIAVVARPTRRWLHVNVAATLVFLGVWAVSRTTGLPMGPMAGQAEGVAFVDGLCVALEGLALAGSIFALARPRAGARLSMPAFVCAVAIPALAVAGLTTAALAAPEGGHDSLHETMGHAAMGSANVQAADHQMDCSAPVAGQAGGGRRPGVRSDARP